MAVKTMNISLPPELRAFIDAKLRSGLYGNASDVIRAGLRALAREEIGNSVKAFEEIFAALPQDPISSELEQEIEEKVRLSRAAEHHKQNK